MSEEIAKSKAITVVRFAVDVAQAVAPIPRFLIWVAALLAAVVYGIARSMNLGALLEAWAKAAQQPPPWDPEKGTGNLSTPIDQPEGGIPIPPKEWKDGEP